MMMIISSSLVFCLLNDFFWPQDVAESLTEEQYEARLALLRGSRVWKSKSNLRTYFEKQWIANGFHKVPAFEDWGHCSLPVSTVLRIRRCTG